MVKSHVKVVNVKLTYLKHVYVKPESVTDEQDEQPPEPNSFLSKSMPTKAIKLAMLKC